MKIVNKILCLDSADLIKAGVPADTLYKASSKARQSWKILEDPHQKGRLLFPYHELRDKYKEMVKKTFGDPHIYFARMPIIQFVERDHEAHKFYLEFRYDEDKRLTNDQIEKYTIAASWLNMLIKVDENKPLLKSQLGISIDQFYLSVLDLIKQLDISLPRSYRFLTATRREYKQIGYNALIDGRLGNKNAAKISDEKSEALLLELIALPNQFDDVFIARQYNAWALNNNYKPITPATVGDWRRKENYQIISSREGQAAFYDKFSTQIKGRRPSCPLFLVESDDNHLDLLFLDPEDRTGSRYFHKYKAIIVIDSFNDYVLGYAYSENLTTEVVRAAYLNAMYHIREITGGWYVPREIKTDRWAIKELEPFYQGIAHYHKTPVGQKRRGYIEQFFGTPHWKRALKLGANNYSGNNMTAVNRGVNVEELALNKLSRPTISEGIQQIETFIHHLRHAKGENGKSKHEQWLEAFCSMPEKEKRQCTEEQFLLKFGQIHRPKNGSKISITNSGVEPQINNVRYSFIVPPALRLKNIGKKVEVIYDPYDMSRVLVTDFENVRFLAYAQPDQPRALADYRKGDRRLINALLAEKEAEGIKVAKNAQRRQEILKKVGIDPEGILQSGVLTKEIRQSAELNFLPTPSAPSSIAQSSRFDNL